MKYTMLGNSDLRVSRICMGCMGFGDPHNGQHSWTLDEAHSRAILRQGLEGGINFFDTAIGYQSGTSEQYLGRALRDFARREEVVVATKFLPRTNEEIADGISGQEHIRRMVDKSLQNLGMDYIDLYIYHMWDYQTPLYDILEGLNQVVKAGKVRYLGISNCLPGSCAKPTTWPGPRGLPPSSPSKATTTCCSGRRSGKWSLLPGGEHRPAPPTVPWPAAGCPSTRGRPPAAGTGQLRQGQVRRRSGPGRPHSRPGGCLGTGAGRVHDGDLPGLAAD